MKVVSFIIAVVAGAPLGSPAMRSEDAFVDEIAARMREAAARAGAVWCIFDNTALDAATPNVLGLPERRRRREFDP